MKTTKKVAKTEIKAPTDADLKDLDQNLGIKKVEKHLDRPNLTIVQRKKKKVLAMKDLRKNRYAKNEFVVRKSLLD